MIDETELKRMGFERQNITYGISSPPWVLWKRNDERILVEEDNVLGWRIVVRETCVSRGAST